MVATTFTSRQFNQDTAGAKKAAATGPVVITDRGSPSHVLLSYERYLALSGGAADIVGLIGMANAAEVEFDPPRALMRAQPAGLS